MLSLKKFILLNISILLYFVIAFFLLGIVGSYLTKLQIHSLKNINQFVFLVLVWMFVRYFNKNINNANRNIYFSLVPVDIIFFLIGIVISIFLFFLSLALLNRINPTEIILLSNLKSIAQFTINNLMISFTEELLFRCLIFFTLLRIVKKVFLAAIVSSVYFLLIHFLGMKDSNLIFWANIFVGGVLLCYLYYVTNSIWTAIGFHLSNNALTNIVEFRTDINGHNNKTHTLIYTIFLLIFLATMFIIQNKWKLKKLSESSA